MENILRFLFIHSASAVADILNDIADGCFRYGILQEFLFDLLDRINDSGVIAAAELLTDLYHWHLCDLAYDIHGV